MDTRNIHELTAAYALDALDAREAEAFEAHLGRCGDCRADLTRLGETATALAWAVEAPAPPRALRGRILEAAAAERRNVTPLPQRPPWVFRTIAGAGAVAACTAIGLGIWAGLLSHRLSSERSARVGDARAIAILSDLGARRVALSGRSGIVVVDPSGDGALVVKRLPAAPPGRTYEAWVIPNGGSAQPAGLFDGGGSTTILALSRPVPSGSTVAVTLERAGGVRAPTRRPLLAARI